MSPFLYKTRDIAIEKKIIVKGNDGKFHIFGRDLRW